MKNKIHFLIITLVCFLLGWQLLRPGHYTMHDDLQVMRVFQMRQCLNDGQIPCRWAANMGFEYGQPLFNFYSAFPYYLGGLINLIGFSSIATVKILFLLSLIVSGIFSYLLAQKYFSKTAALVASIAYLTAPYHALDIFVRGALSESWALALAPMLLYAIVLLIEKSSLNRTLFLSFSIFAFLTTHNTSILMWAPIIIIFTLIHLFKKVNIKVIKSLVAAVFLGVGLSAFFFFPVIFEKSLINTSALTTDYFQFQAHFTSLRQLFLNTQWGYGPSKFGVDDNLSYFVGVIHSLALLIFPFVLFRLLKKQKRKSALILTSFFALSLFSVFMTHGKSVIIWESSPVFAFIQFPWRFLGLTIIGTSFLIGGIIDSLKQKTQKIIVYPILIALVALNFSYFRFQYYFDWMRDSEKLSGHLYHEQIKAAVADYLPVTASKIPLSQAPELPIIISGDVGIHYADKRSNYFSTEIDVYSDSATIQFPIMYFPNWTVYRNSSEEPYPISYDNELGLIQVDIPKGSNLLQLWFENTPIRTASNLISFVSIGVFVLLLSTGKIKESKKKKIK